jgi:general secretion pathway protein C
LPAQWLDKTGNIAERATATVERALHGLAQPVCVRLLRHGLLALLGVWAVFAATELFWALWPQPATPALPTNLVNPVTRSQAMSPVAAVDIQQVQDWHLFGEPGAAEAQAAALAASEAAARAAGERDGIEEGARETRLDLTLRGIVASTRDGLGHAIIEHRNSQGIYAVDDELPVSGNVKLAKVMPGQVVLDNNGTYELLTLFDESQFDAQVQHARRQPPAANRRGPPSASVDKRGDRGVSEIATDYRDRLYENPQSLEALVQISAVREDGELRGYRLMPGREAEQFGQLGFEAGDMVTSINGIALDTPAKTMQVYQTMRNATEATFELERQGRPLLLSVNLQSSTP